ncbi:hypothetical protein MUK42_33083 [Musa troglodytarum]|uniref:Uncharacterized protein n=1 Tax=Musa troglodytarum TaxID=320322 RepID=A0A9E7H9J0_9LILI|nr:hypothetical protein MUK42_33083 [Musa troglodytarum]
MEFISRKIRKPWIAEQIRIVFSSTLPCRSFSYSSSSFGSGAQKHC